MASSAAPSRKPAKAAKPPVTLRRTLVTPEGVDLGVDLAPLASRLAAVVLDLAILCGVLLVLVIVVGLTAWATSGRNGQMDVVAIVWLLTFFILRNAWFVAWEMTPAAATPGKRIMKIRVAMRDGGRLTADAVFARNVTRELEMFLPLTALFGGAAVATNSAIGGFIALALLIWTLILGLIPVFNGDKLRAGDLIAGTWVVQAPKHTLEPDLAAGDHARAVFTAAQLDAYGVMELQVLEDVLRARDQTVMRDVATRIRRKIEWAGEDGPDEDFLTGYYAALRERLEKRLLFGHRRTDKHDRRGLS